MDGVGVDDPVPVAIGDGVITNGVITGEVGEFSGSLGRLVAEFAGIGEGVADAGPAFDVGVGGGVAGFGLPLLSISKAATINVARKPNTM